MEAHDASPHLVALILQYYSVPVRLLYVGKYRSSTSSRRQRLRLESCAFHCAGRCSESEMPNLPGMCYVRIRGITAAPALSGGQGSADDPPMKT
jgi:hypothetical protein